VKIEHAAYQVPDPVAAGEWYVKHLGMTAKRSAKDGPCVQFLADDGDAVMLELYKDPAVGVPDYRAIHPLTMHIAFRAEDMAGTRARLLAAGATAEGEIRTLDNGDQLAMLRDPWGVPIQLAKRAVPMIK
jgi:catechol 2,3-dioxygenase-like lactoylglutathione lyase family enzyme